MKKKFNPLMILVAIYLLNYLYVFFFALFSTVLPDIFEETSINPMDYARITDVEYTATLIDEPGSHGKIRVKERLTFDIHAASEDNLFWELWRDLCEDYVDGVKVDYNVLSVKQIMPDGSKVVFPESRKLYWDDSDYTTEGYSYGCGPNKWFHSPGPYNEYNEQYECVFFYVNGLYREKPIFEIEYEMNNAALRYNDCSELYISMFSEESVNYLNSFKGQILIPTNKMPRRGNYTANTYGTNSNQFAFTESTSINPGYHTFAFELNKSDLKFSNHNEYIEFSLVSFGEDKHKFTKYASINDYSNDNVLDEIIEEQKYYENTPTMYLIVKIIIFVVCLIISFIILKKLLNADNKIENKYKFYQPSMEFDYFRDIPGNVDPLFISDFVFCKDQKQKENQDNYTAVVLSLVRKKYIELERINPDSDWLPFNTKIIIKYSPSPVILHPTLNLVQSSINEIIEDYNEELEPLSPSEELYFNLIKRHAINNEISMLSLESKVSKDYDYTTKFVTNMDHVFINVGISKGYFQKANIKEPSVYLNFKSISCMVWGLLILIVANIVSNQTPIGLAFGAYSILGITLLFGSYIYKTLSKKYILLTQLGEDEYVKWRGLYNFLNSETLMNEKTVIELPIWEQYLVYATAFGISEKVIKALKIRCPELVDSSPILSNSYYRSHNFYSSSRSFRSLAKSSSHFSGGSYGGHGGYGGGGRGGGGGGGGH